MTDRNLAEDEPRRFVERLGRTVGGKKALAHLQDANSEAHHVVRSLLNASYPLDHEMVVTAKRLARLTDEAVDKW